MPASAAERYTWQETLREVTIRVPLPLGTKRSQLQIVLLDAATGANLFLAEVETAGGKERVAERALLRVRPVFWPEPLFEGVLCGAVDPGESSYEMEASGGGDTWDSLVVSLRKARGAECMWGSVVLADVSGAAPLAHAVASGASDADEAAAAVMKLGAAGGASAKEACALRCVQLASHGAVAEVVEAKALPQVAVAMAAHPDATTLLAAGCALLAAVPFPANEATTAAVLGSGLPVEALAAVRRHPTVGPLQLQGARAIASLANGGAECQAALLASGGVRALASMLASPPPTRDLACEALRTLARGGHKARAAVVAQGAAATLVDAIGSASSDDGWRRRCLLVVHSLVLAGDVEALKALLPVRAR